MELSSTPLVIPQVIKSSNKLLKIRTHKTLTRASEFGTIKSTHNKLVLQNLTAVQEKDDLGKDYLK